MKKSLYIVLGFILISPFVSAQINVPEVQKSLYGVYESTGCGYCGQYAIPLTESVVNQVGDKAVFFSFHHSGSQLYSPVAQTIASAIGGAGTPYWSLNANPLGYYSTSLESTIVNTINSNYSDTSAVVNTGFESYMQNDTIYVETLTQFFDSVNGDYNVAVYLSEDNIYAYQSNYASSIPSGDIYHDKILRTSFSQNAFGTQVASGGISSGSTFTNFHKIKIDPNWNLNHTYISVVVWKNNGGNYEFENVNDAGEGVLIASVQPEQKQNIELKVYPNPVSENLSVDLNNTADNSLVRLIDMNGRIVYENRLTQKGEVTVNIDVANLASGKYIVSMISEESVRSEQIIVK